MLPPPRRPCPHGLRPARTGSAEPAGSGLVRRFTAARRSVMLRRGHLARAALPARRDLRRRRAPTSRCSPRSPSAVELCLFDDDGSETRVDLPEVAPASCWHGYLPGVGPGQRYGFRVHGPCEPDRGPALQPGQAAARPVRQGRSTATSTGTRPCFGYRFADPDGRANDDDSAPHVPKSVVVEPVLRLGRRPAAAHAVARDGHLRGPRQGLHHAPPRRPRGAARHLRRPRPPRRHRPPRRASASPPSSCCRCTSSCTTPHLVERGLRNYWGYNSIGFFAPHNELRRRRARAASRSHEFKPMVQGAARGRHRGDPRRRLQPHRRGQPPRARRCRSRASTTPPTTGSSPTTRATTWTTRAPATA